MRVAAAAGFAVLALAGCGGGSGVGAGASASDAQATSSSPSATASDLPGATKPGASASPTDTARPRERATDPATANRVTLVKSGGFAGVHEQVVVEPDGRWTYTTRDGARKTGRLTPAQTQELRKLSSSTALASEGTGKARAPKCADAFLYTLTVGDMVIHHQQCGSPPGPTFAAIVRLLSDATPLT